MSWNKFQTWWITYQFSRPDKKENSDNKSEKQKQTNSNHGKQITFLMKPNETLKNNGDFYCYNCFHYFRT